jgi:hypothetical protein
MSTIKSSAEHLTLNADGASKDIILQNNGSTKVTVKSDGKLGVGTASPSQALHVAGNIYTTGYLNTAGSGTAGGVQFADGNLYMYRDSNDLAIKLQGSEKLRIQSGGGISFNGDTAAANALDDYEEGVHDVTISDSGGGATYTFTSGYSKLAYTKIGRTVHVTGTLVISTVSGTPSGWIELSLPFTSGNTDQLSAVAGASAVSYYYVYSSNAAGVYPLSRIDESTSVIKCLYGGVNAAVHHARLNNGAQLYVNTTYMTA